MGGPLVGSIKNPNKGSGATVGYSILGIPQSQESADKIMQLGQETTIGTISPEPREGVSSRPTEAGGLCLARPKRRALSRPTYDEGQGYMRKPKDMGGRAPTLRMGPCPMSSADQRGRMTRKRVSADTTHSGAHILQGLRHNR